jgi:hypothetical protein
MMIGMSVMVCFGVWDFTVLENSVQIVNIAAMALTSWLRPKFEVIC